MFERKQSGQLIEEEFCENKQDDSIEQVIYLLVCSLTKLLKSESEMASFDKFNQTVDMNIHETLNRYLLQQYGRDHRVLGILKMCNQSSAISVQNHVRAALLSKNIQFKDPRPSYWAIEFTSDGQCPTVIQRRREQVYEMSTTNGFNMVRLFVFEWQLVITFDSLEVNHISEIAVELVDLDFTKGDKPIPDETQEDFRKVLGDLFAPCKRIDLEIAV